MKTNFVRANLNGRIPVLLFRYKKSDIAKVCSYILNQPEHHRKISYMEEYEEFIKFYQKTINPK
ncbi:MAG TPA: hypothetical protein VFC67_04190 [Prolixibacteraceae bacterium]|nr:hypothetical protein [Prolixibacteraceae bacterium]